MPLTVTVRVSDMSKQVLYEFVKNEDSFKEDQAMHIGMIYMF